MYFFILGLVIYSRSFVLWLNHTDPITITVSASGIYTQSAYSGRRIRNNAITDSFCSLLILYSFSQILLVGSCAMCIKYQDNNCILFPLIWLPLWPDCIDCFRLHRYQRHRTTTTNAANLSIKANLSKCATENVICDLHSTGVFLLYNFNSF